MSEWYLPKHEDDYNRPPEPVTPAAEGANGNHGARLDGTDTREEGDTVQARRRLSFEERARLAQQLGERALRLLNQMVTVDPGPVVWALPFPERTILVFDVERIQGMALPAAFVKRFIGTLNGRRAAFDERYGAFVQVGYLPEGPVELRFRDLDLGEQPGEFFVPIGETKTGALWLDIRQMDSVLIGGTRQMGKTTLLRSWIRALINGKRCTLVLWDGKRGVEFDAFAHQPNVRVAEADGLGKMLLKIHMEVVKRMELFKDAQVRHISEYNADRRGGLRRIVLFIDEAKEVQEMDMESLGKLLAIGGAFGVHVVIATQYPNDDAVKSIVKANLATRIALGVPSHIESQVILGQSGAEKMPKIQGRLMLIWQARKIEAQAYYTEQPKAGDPLRVQLLTDRELRLVDAALTAGGWFRVKDIAGRAGESAHYVNAVAKRWEKIGYLTEVQRNEQGHNIGRRVTPSLLDAAGRSGRSGDVGDRGDLGDQG